MKESEYPERQRADWEAAKAEGPLRYVLVRGVLAWGVPTGAFVLSCEYFLFHQNLLTHELLLKGFVFLMGGIFYGAFDWKPAERRYRKSG